MEEHRRVETPLGPIEYLLTVKAVKNLNLRLRPDGTVAVSLPRRAPKSAADAFVRSRAEWIFRHRQGLRRELLPLVAPDREAALPVLAAYSSNMRVSVLPLSLPSHTYFTRLPASSAV